MLGFLTPLQILQSTSKAADLLYPSSVNFRDEGQPQKAFRFRRWLLRPESISSGSSEVTKEEIRPDPRRRSPSHSCRRSLVNTRSYERSGIASPHPQKRWFGKAEGTPPRKLKILGRYPLRADSELGFVYNFRTFRSCKGTRKTNYYGEGILSLLYFITRIRRVAATWYRVNDLIAGCRNYRVVLPNRSEVALLTFLDVDAVVWTYCGGSDEKVSASGGRSRVGVCRAAVQG